MVAARTANPLKLRQIAAFGADVRLDGEDIEDARLLAREIAEADRAYLVEDSLDLSWRKPTVVETDRIETIADDVAARCPIPEVLDDLLVELDDVMLVREESIKASMRMLYEHAGLVVEPSAALGVAAVLEEPERFAGRRVTTILCGSNVGAADFARWCWNPSRASAVGTTAPHTWPRWPPRSRSVPAAFDDTRDQCKLGFATASRQMRAPAVMPTSARLRAMRKRRCWSSRSLRT